MEPKAASDRVLVFMPSYNDFELIDQLAKEIDEIPGDTSVLLIDDGSSVHFDVNQLSHDLLYVRLPSNFGIGLCTHIAFDHALAEKYKAIVRIDADGQHPVKHITELLAPISNDDADIVVGARVNRNTRNGLRGIIATIVRGYLSRIIQVMTRGAGPKDVTSGFFAANRAAIEYLNRHQLERYPEPLMYMLLCRGGLRLKEIDVQQVSRAHGTSTLNIAEALRLFYRFNIYVLGEILQGNRGK